MKKQHFTPIDGSVCVDERERSIVQFWEEHAIFRKSVDGENGKSRKDRLLYTFYDGPPFATGLPHYGHIVGQTVKDVVPRYQTMRGKRVERRWGWDCHGLPIENLVEKEMGSQTKKDIEALGVEKFNEMCRSKVLMYADEWAKIIPRLGRWVDMEHQYRTMDRGYMESVWWVFKRLWDKGLIYESYRSMHICPRCETTLSQSEVSEGYRDIKDISVVAQFELADEPGTFVLAWTTTPWTLPGNVALAVGEDITYIKVLFEGKHYIIAQERAEKVFAGKNYVEEMSLKGDDLIGRAYKPLFDCYAQRRDVENRENGWKIYGADFVTTESGTGIVHIAPAFGEDDMMLGKKNNLPFIQHVGMDGVIEGCVGAPLAGRHVKPKGDTQSTDVEIIKYLAHRNLLFHKEKYAHSYPHCWRCDTPLLNYATSSWFVAVTKIKAQLQENAQEIHWSPAHLKEGRFGKWLNGARDWSISRQRFWASVIPVWVCDACGTQEVFGAVADLEVRSGKSIGDLHKHVVDAVTFSCAEDACAGTMRRVPDVLDTWFDSGAMPYAQEHYPFENREAFAQSYPADFIAEGVDQTRAWFYYLHVLSGALEVGGVHHDESTRAFTNVIVNGTVLAEDGKKMSKKLQNYPDPMDMVRKYGADALRLYLMTSPVVAAADLRFSEKALRELSRNLFRMVRQSYAFFVLYANVDGWQPSQRTQESVRVHRTLLDQWILARLSVLTRDVTRYMDAYELHKASRAFAPFVDDLSNWYIRRSRKRFWKSDDDSDKGAAYATLYTVLVELSKLMAPLTPFIAEEMYRNLTQSLSGAKESVHLEDYPKETPLTEHQESILAQMALVRDVISQGLELRAKAGIKVRQPLASLAIPLGDISDDLVAMIVEEVNVHSVNTDADAIALDTNITPELEREGQARELIRHIQQARKRAGLEVDDRITLSIVGADAVLDAHEGLIAHEVLCATVSIARTPLSDATYSAQMHDGATTIDIALRRAE